MKKVGIWFTVPLLIIACLGKFMAAGRYLVLALASRSRGINPIG